MDLTIVIVSFKSGEILNRCIDSIANKYPIIVVENSLDYNKKKELEKKYSNLKCLIPKKNLGYGAGNNLGINEAKTKYVLILNPDTKLYENTIENLLDQAKKIHDFALLGPEIVEQNNESNQNFGNNLNEENAIPANYIKGFAILFNKGKFNNIGFFDENFFLYFEEIDLCKRMIDSKNKIYLIKNSKIKHMGGKSHEEQFNLEMELSRNWHWMWSTFYYYKKHNGFVYAFLNILRKFFSSFIKMIFFSLTFNKKKRNIYFQRLSGILNSMIGKKSWYRPNINKN